MIGYSQCWEDTELILKALDIRPYDKVISVTSGGCNVLALSSGPVGHIYSVDKNNGQNHLLELKLAAIKNLGYADVIGFLGYAPSQRRKEIYLRLVGLLSPDARQYWRSNRKSINKGIVHCGKFEHYLFTFRNFILPLIHCPSLKNRILNPADSQAQIDFYDHKWNTFRWRLLFKIFFSRFVMSRKGRNKEMFSQNQRIPVGAKFFRRIEQGFRLGNLKDNFYYNYVFFGTKSKLLPYYLDKAVFERLKNSKNISIHSSDMLSFLKEIPSGSIHKYNLSDIFEPIDIPLSNCIFDEIYRTAAPGARLIFWNNLVPRDVPGYMKNYFQRDIDLEHELKASNKVFFYAGFFIYTILK